DCPEENNAPQTRCTPEHPRRRAALMRRLLRVLFAVVALGILGWGALALHFAGPGHGRVADALAGAWVVVGLAILVFVRPFGRRLAAFGAAVVVPFLWGGTIRPPHDPAREPGAGRRRAAAIWRGGWQSPHHPQHPELRLPLGDRLHRALGDPLVRSLADRPRRPLHVVLGLPGDRPHDHELGVQRRPASRDLDR